MPQVAGHFVVAEKLAQALGNPAELTQNPAALHLGAIGPDLFLMLFDTPKMENFQGLLNEVIGFYDVIHEVRECFESITDALGGPIEDLADWILGDLNNRLLSIVSLSAVSLVEMFKLNLIPEVGPMAIPNPYAGMGIPGISNAPTMTIKASDLSIVLRQFGHPYSVDVTSAMHYKDFADWRNYKDWWWMDILHYRRTVPFAKRLLDAAGADDFLKAYATGYFSHVGADICGHPFTNALVGGPFRTHVIRHMVLENISDTWIWDHYHHRDMVSAKLDTLIDLNDNQIAKIVDFLITQLNQVYPDAEFTEKRKPTRDELIRAYTTMKHYLRVSTDSGIDPPQPPPSGLTGYIEEAWESIVGTGESIGNLFDSDNEWWEWLLAPFLAAAYAAVLLFKIATAPAQVIRNLSTSSLQWLAYDIQRALWEFIMNARWQLVLGGWGKPSTYDLTREFAQTGYVVPSSRTGTGVFDYPYRQVSHTIHGFWLIDPSQCSTLDSPRAECCPFPKTADPSIYIDGPAYDQLKDTELKNFAIGVSSPADTIDLEHATVRGPQFGNAVEFTKKMMTGSYPIDGFDLDGDIGYGFKCWGKDYENDTPYYDKKFWG